MKNTDTRKLALAGDYPLTWDEYVGQDAAKRRLRVAAQSAKTRNATLGHVLLKSPHAGIGKTALALLVAMTMDRPVRIVSGVIKAGEARILLSGMTDGDILIVDEFHRMFSSGKAAGEWLLHYMQDGILMGPLGPEPAPSVTIIGATTDAGVIPEPVLQRFEMPLLLDRYDEREGALIALQLASRVFPDDLPLPSVRCAKGITEAANHQPRIMRQILCALRDLVVVGEVEKAADYDLTEALVWCGLSPDGLTKEARGYLRVLLEEFAGQAGAATLASRLGEKGDGLAFTERLLMDKGLVAKTRQGRALTAEGIRRARVAIEEGVAA